MAPQNDEQCIFCQIVSGQIPSKKVYEDDFFSVILDINPANPGHCLWSSIADQDRTNRIGQLRPNVRRQGI